MNADAEPPPIEPPDLHPSILAALESELAHHPDPWVKHPADGSLGTPSSLLAVSPDQRERWSKSESENATVRIELVRACLRSAVRTWSANLGALAGTPAGNVHLGVAHARLAFTLLAELWVRRFWNDLWSRQPSGRARGADEVAPELILALVDRFQREGVDRFESDEHLRAHLKRRVTSLDGDACKKSARQLAHADLPPGHDFVDQPGLDALGPDAGDVPLWHDAEAFQPAIERFRQVADAECCRQGRGTNAASKTSRLRVLALRCAADALEAALGGGLPRDTDTQRPLRAEFLKRLDAAVAWERRSVPDLDREQLANAVGAKNITLHAELGDTASALLRLLTQKSIDGSDPKTT